MKSRLLKDFLRGLWDENPVFRLLIGLCPTLGVTTSALNGMSMALATTIVLVFSSILISTVKKIIPGKVRIPAYIIMIATFVTTVDLTMQAYLPDLHASLGVFIPLIVVNCLILGRAEAYASKMPVMWSGFDALGMGIGFTWALTALGGIRELLGTGSIFGIELLPESFSTLAIMTSPPGAFLTLGFLLAFMNLISDGISKAISAMRRKPAN